MIPALLLARVCCHVLFWLCAATGLAVDYVSFFYSPDLGATAIPPLLIALALRGML